MEKFLDRLPDELIERCIWPRLLILPPVNDAGRCIRPLTREEHKEHIRQIILLRQVCRRWYSWVSKHEDWIYGVCNYIEVYIIPEEYDRRYISSDEGEEYYDSDREPSCWK